MLNFATINTFQGGHSNDIAEGIEKKDTYIKGLNGRIYSHNGTFSFTSIEGSKEVYRNNNIVKFLGYHSFRDETIVFAKCVKLEGDEDQWTEVCEDVLEANDFTVKGGIVQDTITLSSEINDNTLARVECHTEEAPGPDDGFELPYSEVEDDQNAIDFGEYYSHYMSVADYSVCSIGGGEVPMHNREYFDAILSFSLDDNGQLQGKTLWRGPQNWPMNGKISCEGVEENEFYKRVYYTDGLNPKKVVNIKDTSLASRKANEFSQTMDNVLLQPEVREVISGGQLKTMRALYLYRIISENGQVSEFSPFSSFVDIVPDDDNFRGGDISEKTDRAVDLVCNLIDPQESSQVECVALEFEALGPPTAIRNLGTKPASSIVSFRHYGNEPEMSDDITIHDILEQKNSWKYCNDFTSKKNKLIAGGLRNNPLPSAIENMEYLFPLHSWDKDGLTFESLMNPEPWRYRYVDPSNRNKLVYVKRKKYERISSYGPFTLTLANKTTDYSVSLEFPDISLEGYTDVLPEVTDWLLEEQEKDYFTQEFPNLKVTKEAASMMFTYHELSQTTDMSDYVLSSDNEQFIELFKNDIDFTPTPVDTDNLVHGAQSIGFHQGTGVRVSYREVKEPLLNQATKVYDGTDRLLDYHRPSMEKYFMKGELYRLAFQAYDNASSRYFSIPLGDVMIPEIGDIRTEIDGNGNAVITSTEYVNQSVENGVLYGHGVKMHIEVRLSCELQEMISMYQLLYVERTEENRTILCQGVSAPLTRVQTNGSPFRQMPDSIENKWNLPYYGGPVYERRGLSSYDQHGENHVHETHEAEDRVMTHRRLMYFDSPELYFNKISDQYIGSSRLNVVGKLNTDHTPGAIMESGHPFGGTFTPESYPKFSRKILEGQLDGNVNADHLPKEQKLNEEEDTWETYFVNVSVFSKYSSISKMDMSIDHVETLRRGEIISGAAFNMEHDVSNNAVVMPCMPWFFSSYQRKWEDNSGNPTSEMFGNAIASEGYRTSIIKTNEDLFTDAFIGPDVHTVNSQIRLGGSGHIVYDTYPLINIYRNNRESVFGGRTQQAYSRNTFIPLSRTIPVSGDTGVQSFDVGGDVYVTLNIRTKNDANPNEERVGESTEFTNHGGGREQGAIVTHIRNGAWNYVTVLETQVEPKLTYGYEFYREEGSHNFEMPRQEVINEAYFNERNMKQFIPKPFGFEDDPDMGNVVAVSDTKMSGESHDAWTSFKPNNFYAGLEKNMGDISNLVRFKDQIFAIQEGQTSLLHIGTDRIISDEQGRPINIRQGSGEVVEGHQVLSPYGTAIRRSVSENDFGFVFFDEKNLEFMKMDKPLLAANLLHLDLWNELKTDPVVDVESFFDHKNKESNVRLRTTSGKAILISYNEMFKKFNGRYEYDNDLYIPFDKKIYVPVATPGVLHQLNEGDYLNIFGQQRDLKVEVVVHGNPGQVLQYKHTGISTSLDYPFKALNYKTSLGQERTVTGAHERYFIKEGQHSIPAKNNTTDRLSPERNDLRGEWISVEVVAESLNKNKVDILALINSLRQSHR